MPWCSIFCHVFYYLQSVFKNSKAALAMVTGHWYWWVLNPFIIGVQYNRVNVKGFLYPSWGLLFLNDPWVSRLVTLSLIPQCSLEGFIEALSMGSLMLLIPASLSDQQHVCSLQLRDVFVCILILLRFSDYLLCENSTLHIITI